MIVFDQIRARSRSHSTPDLIDGRNDAGRIREGGYGILAAIMISSALLIIGTSLATLTLSSYRYQHRSYLGDKSEAIAEAGAERAIYQLNQPGSTYTGETGTSFGGGTYDVSVSGSGSTKYVTVTSRVSSGILPVTRKVKVTLAGTPSDSAAFNYGVQVGTGGLDMSNSSVISGGVYSNGNAVASNTAQVQGDLWVAGSTGVISGFTAGSAWGITGNAHAHSISGSEIQKDAYYQTLTSTTVGGTKHPGSSDPAATSFSISDQQISDWKDDAVSGGSQGSLTLSSGTTSIGPKKIAGNLTLSNTATLNLTGTLWVTGNVSISNSAKIKIDSSFGTNGTELIADGPIVISNSGQITGSGNSKSFQLAISTYTNTSKGSPAITLSNGDATVKNDVLYAPHGWVVISNSANLREVTGYGLDINNGATVSYDQGLASASFTSGPGGRWAVTAWQELH